MSDDRETGSASKAGTPSGAPESAPLAATPAEIIKALESLTEADVLRLEYIARARHAVLLRGSSMKPRELLQEAVRRIAAGKRAWKPGKKDFIEFVSSVMESLLRNDVRDASKERRRRADEAALDDEARMLDDGMVVTSPLNNMEKEEAAAAVRQSAADVFAAFEGDGPACDMLTCWSLGMREPEVLTEMKWSEKEYNTIQRRIRRKISRLGLREDGHGQRR